MATGWVVLIAVIALLVGAAGEDHPCPVRPAFRLQ